MFFTERRVDVSMAEGEFIDAEIFELILGKAKFPRDVAWMDGEGVIVFDEEGHGEVVK